MLFIIKKNNTDNNDELVTLDKSLIEEICGDNFEINEDECQILFFDKLMTFVKPTHLWACANSTHFSNTVIEHLFSMSIGKSIANINSKVAAIKTFDKKDSPKILKAVKELKLKTEQDIAAIDEYLSPSDVRYISVHDALADHILQSAIDSYNNAKNTSSVARDVYALMQYAGELAKGSLIKKRCEDNIKVVKKVVDELPPAGLETADKQLFAAITRARNSSDTIEKAIDLLKSVESNLSDISLRQQTEKNRKIKEHITDYFTKVSTIIANVCLNKIIEDVNNAKYSRSRHAWQIITALNQLPLDVEFKNNRYNNNVETLLKNIELLGIKYNKDDVSYELIDIRPENIVWEESNKNNDYNHYIKRFPNGLHIKEAKELQEEIDRKNAEQRRLQEAENARRRLIKEAEQAKKVAEEEKRRQIEEEERARKRQLEIEELYKQEKLERETKFLNWTIGVLVTLIIFLLVYLFWGWAGIKTVFIIIGIILGLIVWGWITG